MQSRILARSSAATFCSLLPLHFVEEYRAGAGDIQGICLLLHGNGNGFVAGFEYLWRNAVTFAAENDATIGREVGLSNLFFPGVRMGSHDADALLRQFAE